MENKLSAVQWLKNEVKCILGDIFVDFNLDTEFEQAEKMFAEQIMKANADGVDSILDGLTPIGEKEYYENNFNNQ